METLQLSPFEQTTKCKHCPNKDSCPLRKCQVRTRVKKCTWHDYTSKEYRKFIDSLELIDKRLAQTHYKAREAALEIKVEKAQREFDATLERVSRELRLMEHMTSGKPCVSFEQIQWRNQSYKVRYVEEAAMIRLSEDRRFARFYLMNRDNETRLTRLSVLREFWDDNLYTTPN